MRIMLRSKLHRLHLTGADPDYEGSIAIDTNLLAAAGIIENEMVHVWNVTNGERLETYAIKAPAGSGEVSLNGAVRPAISSSWRPLLRWTRFVRAVTFRP
jgi:aspartate 1-decarboxylase